MLIWKSELLSQATGVVHGVSTRLGGVSGVPFATLNMGFHTGDRPEAVIENRRRFLARLGTAPEASVWGEQVHGAEVTFVGSEHAGRGAYRYTDAIPGVDGLVTTTPGLVLAAAFADCVPVLLADREGKAVAVAHAGWRGTLAGVALRCVEILRAAGVASRRLLVAIGPSIRSCCYEVSEELAGRFERAIGPEAVKRTRRATPALALAEANRMLLIEAGVPPEAIEISTLCTACRTDLFFSHRAEHGATGRLAAVVGRVGK